MWCRWELDGDFIAWPDSAARDDDAHNPRLANQLSLRSATKHCCSKARLKLVELFTRIAQPGDFDYCGVTNVKLGSGRQSQKVNIARSDVLADLPWVNAKPLSAEFFEELLMNEMHLPEVGLRWVLGDA